MRLRVWAVALTITATASAGLLLLLLEPVSDVRWPFVYAAAGSALLSAAAGALDLATRRRRP